MLKDITETNDKNFNFKISSYESLCFYKVTLN